jgi:hypothetical protein
MNKIQERLNGMSTEMIKEIATQLNNRLDDEANIVFENAMNALLNRMSEKDFVKFCEKLEKEAA